MEMNITHVQTIESFNYDKTYSKLLLESTYYV